ncbi:hypothetical protein [Psychrobacter sp. FDAARGOS_221]|uniref:hypothetical protein n=1 Tax=Psychrobacter sp. FDAARGOS_221 TaxID=1975705 RepID=UPI000BB577C6|nr:hypothetical protein [Psychrobacter sp. FDAARGOS_221]PNK61525.1 hypothetical protein A6J60_012055 [Psychrobacter sp. FDAARGOS_221]
MQNIKNPNPSVWLSREAIELSTKLMINLHIQQGSNLATLLGLSPIFYNDEAIRIWVQRELDEGLPMNRFTLSHLESMFLGLMELNGIPYSI